MNPKIDALQPLTRRKFLSAAARTISLGALALLLRPEEHLLNAQPTGIASWRKITPVNDSPPARSNHLMIYDAAQDRLILFGGRGPSGVLNDVWAFSFKDGTWANLTPTGETPAPRFTPTAVYDPQKNRMVTYSGMGAGFFNDTWAFDLASNRWEELKGDPRPAPRYGTILAYDSKRHGALTFAGFTSEGGRFDDTWHFSLESDHWQDLGPIGPRPGRRCLHMGAYDLGKDRLVIYGGQRSGPLDDLWAFDVETRTWRELMAETKPEARMFASMVYDTEEKRLLVFGGRGATIFGDLWAFDTQQEHWTSLTPSGEGASNRHSHSAVWVPGGGMYVFGGSSDSAVMSDLWVLAFN